MVDILAAGPIAAAPATTGYAGFWRRAVALIIDWVIVSACVYTVFLLLAAMVPGLGNIVVLRTPFGLFTQERTIESTTTGSADRNSAVKTTVRIVEQTVLGKWVYHYRVTETAKDGAFSSPSTTWHTTSTKRQRIDPVTGLQIKSTDMSSVALLVLFIYWILMDASRYQGSIGKLALGMRVVDDKGQRLTLPVAVGRNLLKILSAMTLFVGFMMSGWTRRKQALHDKIAGCLIVKDS